MSNFRSTSGVLFLSAMLISGCSKTTADSSSQTSSKSPDAISQSNAIAAPQATMTQLASTTTAGESPVATVNENGSTNPPLPVPSDADAKQFNGAMLIAAFAAQSSGGLTQADGVDFSLLNTQTGLACDNIRKDFADDFAAHKNADPYLKLLQSSAKPMSLVSMELPTRLGTYDFNGKQFPIGSGYGDGAKTFTFNVNVTCSAPWPTMPDKSYVHGGVVLEADDGDKLHLYPVDPDKAQLLQRDAYKHELSEQLVFYPVTIARRSNGQIGAIVHVTKVVLRERPSGAPSSAVPTVLMSVNNL